MAGWSVYLLAPAVLLMNCAGYMDAERRNRMGYLAGLVLLVILLLVAVVLLN
jgi:hypothetical protein